MTARRHRGSVCTTREHGRLKMTPVCSQAVLPLPCRLAVDTGSVYSTRVHGARVGKKQCRAMLLLTRPVDTGDRYLLPVFTGRQHCLCSRVVKRCL